jgi:hypothetical protein
VPIKAPKTYFADRCADTTNFIMITERLPYAKRSDHPFGSNPSLAPFALERAHSKFHDHHLGVARDEYYFVLVRKLARLGGWYKSSREIAAQLNTEFPWNAPGFGIVPHPAPRSPTQLPHTHRSSSRSPALSPGCCV